MFDNFRFACCLDTRKTFIPDINCLMILTSGIITAGTTKVRQLSRRRIGTRELRIGKDRDIITSILRPARVAPRKEFVTACIHSTCPAGGMASCDHCKAPK